jgi:hypothetical protein
LPSSSWSTSHSSCFTVLLFWELYFLPFSVHAQTNIICVTLFSLFWCVF